MNWVLKFIPIEVIFVFLTNFLVSTIKNPRSAKAIQLRPLLIELQTTIGALLEKLDANAIDREF